MEEKKEKVEEVAKWAHPLIPGIKATPEKLEEHFRKNEVALTAIENIRKLSESKYPVNPEIIKNLLGRIRFSLPKEFFEETSQKE